eukprot:3271258-Amphidinium_carterae.1
MAKHMEEVDGDVASHGCVSTVMDQQSETQLAQDKLSQGGRVHAELDREAWARWTYHLHEHAAGCLGGTQNRGRVFGVPGIASTGSDLAEDRENAFDEPGSSMD